jgi:hypothetical protein
MLFVPVHPLHSELQQLTLETHFGQLSLFSEPMRYVGKSENIVHASPIWTTRLFVYEDSKFGLYGFSRPC